MVISPMQSHRSFSFNLPLFCADCDFFVGNQFLYACCKLFHFWKLFMGLLVKLTVQELPPVFITFVAWSISEVNSESH
ncbi:hypothetical protein ACJIZ3_008728 [Penstemon smallii]|uniref:Uncharacterized protein n=1 Tax=Penstemon smallii TaxID=265156 RepID=A0ABD3TCD4_9LAMI